MAFPSSWIGILANDRSRYLPDTSIRFLMKSRVTVLLPVYNAMPHLQHTIESLRGQSLSDFKVLAYDDGSTDGSGEYLDQINDERFEIVHQDNAGLAITLNRMLQRVDTEFIARMDSDDICMPRRLQHQLAFMDSHPDVSVAGARQGYVMGRKSMASMGVGRFRLTLSYSPPMSDPPYWDPDRDGNILVHSAVIMRTEALRAVGGYPEIVPGQDLALWYRFAEAGHRLASMDELLLLIRISSGGISSSNIERQCRTWEYVRVSHRMRQEGKSPPTLEEFMQHYPSDTSLKQYRLLKAEFRNACGMMLEGKPIRGILRALRVTARNPKILRRMINGRVRRGSPQA